MYQVGVTGGIGSGKTLVCNVFEKLGIPVYHADERARELMNSDEGLKEGIRELFGNDVYVKGIIDRKKVAGLVFADPQHLKGLNRLVHPVVRTDYLEWVAAKEDPPYVMEEAAILFESGASEGMDEIVLVYADEAVRLKRVMDRDGSDRESVRLRMDNQMDEEEKRTRADHIIYNNGTEMLLPQIIDIHQKILERR